VLAVVALAHAPQVAGGAGVVRQRPQGEAVVGEHHERGVAVHGRQVLAQHLVGVAVDLLHGAPELPLLLGQLARERAGAEEMAEEVGHGVRGLDVGEEHRRPVLAPALQPQPPVGLGGGQGPLEVAHLVVEVEGTRQLLGGHVDEARRLRGGHVRRTAHAGRDAREELGRMGHTLALAARLLGEEEVVAGVVAHHRALHRLRGPGGPPAHHRYLAARLREDVPDRLHLAHPARDRELLAAGPHRHEVSDAVLVRGLAGGDGRPDHRAEQGRAAVETPVGPLLAQPGEVWQPALGEQEVDSGRVHAVEGQDHHPRLPRRARAGGPQSHGGAGEGGHDDDTTHP
jgi:hypothetical protein